MSDIYDDSLNESAEQIKAFFASKIKIDKKANKIYIKGINYNKFLVRIKDMYDTKSVNNIFTKNYTVFTQKLWEQKKIKGNQRKMSNLEVDLFFAQELYNILMELADYYNMNYYKRMAKYIYDNTYLSNADKQPTVKVDMSILDRSLNEKYKPKDFQEEFIRKYFEYKEIYELDGYILSFDQGLGKTFTAACIAEIINPDQVIIICLNSLKENWANELRMYFKRYNNEETFKEEVYIHGISKQKYSDKTKYIIVNNESINKIFPLVKGAKSTMIVVDESQNFRNLDSLQTKNMLKLKEITKCKDNLIMSGTPIKANPSEIVPAMIMIDPTFTMDLARVYIKSFTSNVESLSNVVTPRFNKTVYRKTKDQVLNLPTKTVTNFQLKYRNEEPYLMRTVRNQITERFKEILASYKDEIDAVKDEFRQTTLKYSSQDRTTTLDYIKFVDNGQDYESIHDSLYDLYDGFLRQQVYPNIKDKKEYDRYKYVVSVYVYLTQKCFFLAMGEIMPKVKAQAFIELYDNNIDLIVKMIDNNPKKTVIFSTIVEVVEHIYDDLNKRDIKTVKITGKVKNRMDIINQFRNDDTVDVLVATSQTIGTGVTLVEASQMFIFGPPYRKADFDQACDRLHRIGQTHPVNIYNIVGACTAKDVTNRMTDILEWSDKMVSSVLDNITNEQTLLFEYCQFINTANDLVTHEVYNIDDDSELMDEAMIFTHPNKEYKVDRFINGSTNILFITGFSGGGKSTLAKELADKYKAEYIELDRFMYYINSNESDNDIYADFFYRTEEGQWFINEILHKKNMNMTYIEEKTHVNNIMDYLLAHCRKNRYKKFIIEGIQIFIWEDYKKIKDYSLIIKGTSALKSIRQRLKRENQKLCQVNMLQILKWYMQDNRDLRKMQNAILKESMNYIDDYIEYYSIEDPIQEEAVYDSTHKIPVFIVLMKGYSILSKIISKATNSQFTHVAISFNSKLTPMYSFGMKESLELTDMGFVVNNPKVKEYERAKVKYSVYVMYITRKEYEAIQVRLNWFKEKQDYLKFDFKGLVKYAFNKSSDDRLNKWFCSRFVMELIGQTQKLERDPSLYSPQQVADEIQNISIVNKGDSIYEYDYRITENNMKKIQQGIYDIIDSE